MVRKLAMVSARAPGYTVEVLGKRFPVIDMVQASKLIDVLRDQSGYGASEMGSQFPIREASTIIGYVSYNGKVWRGSPRGPGKAELVYDPFATNPQRKPHRKRNPGTDAENDAEYTRGWKDGVKMLQSNRETAFSWWREWSEETGGDGTWYDMGRGDVISEAWAASGIR